MPARKSGNNWNLRDLVTFRADTSDPSEQNSTYDGVTLENVPCEVRDVGGGELIRGHQVEADITHVIRTRRYDLLYKDRKPHRLRADFDGLELNVRRVLLGDDRRDEMFITCSSEQD